LKAKFHPKAFLSTKRNVKLGLKARTQVIQALENTALNVRGVCKVTGLSYRIVVHHLRLLEAEKVVTRKGKKPFTWELTGAGQQRLVNLKPH
jgi:DNA-binding transcriptional ArsR family regulator